MEQNKETAVVKNPPIPKNYGTEFLVIERGNGVYIKDAAGKEYLDFGSGIAVNALGYGREDLARTAYEQMMRLVHISNLYTTPQALALAEKLTKTGNFSSVHLGNSGSEANEAALKYSRVYAQRVKGPGHHKFLCFEHAFHGRTMGALSCTPKAIYQEPFAPLVPGVEVAPYNDPEALARVLDRSFAAVIVEVIQGEGGLEPMTRDFAKALNELCAKNDVILIADEVQTGLGRTGYLYASEMVGLKPDIVTLAKPLAGGLPLSATLLPPKVHEIVKAGDHGSTFGGGPVTTAVAAKVLDIILEPGFLPEVRRKGDILQEELIGLSKTIPFAMGLKGAGMLRGLVLNLSREGKAIAMADVVKAAQEEGLIVLRSGENVIRMAPPLIIPDKEIKEGIARLARALKRFA
jgi:acetylornithine/N-succinyldiaminopimelate aminotransferase